MSIEKTLTISTRTYSAHDGYALIQIWEVWTRPSPPNMAEVHKIRVTVRHSDASANAATVDRWSGSEWREVVHLEGSELTGAPRQSQWLDTDGRELCKEWLGKVADTAFTEALAVLA